MLTRGLYDTGTKLFGEKLTVFPTTAEVSRCDHWTMEGDSNCGGPVVIVLHLGSVCKWLILFLSTERISFPLD